MVVLFRSVVGMAGLVVLLFGCHESVGSWQGAYPDASDQAGASGQTAPVHPGRDSALYGSILFERNVGQMDDESVAFTGRGNTFQVEISAQEAVAHLFFSDSEGGTIAVPLTFTLSGANEEAELYGDQPTGSESLYWRPDAETLSAPNFHGVTVVDAYPGIDVSYYGYADSLGFDMYVSAGADLSEVRLAFPGQEFIELSPDGEAVFDGEVGVFSLSAPWAYQIVEGEPVEVEVGFRLLEDASLGFWVGEYREDLPLVIDPVLNFTSILADGYAARVADMVVGDNIYVLSEVLALSGNPGPGNGL